MSDKVAIVTGGGGGIGAATARRLAEQGALVAVVDRDEAKAVRTAAELTDDGHTAIAVVADVTDTAAVRAAVDSVHTTLGPPSILVNNAGLARDVPFEDMTVQDWDVVLDTNLRGAFVCCRAVAPLLVEQSWGRIVNLSSMAAHGTRSQAAYSAAKSAVQGLTRSLAIELGPHSITVNAVAPGYIRTDMTAGSAASIGMDFTRLQRVVAAQTPLRRIGEPDDIAGVIAFLAGDAGGFITGQVITVSGGLMVA